MRVAGTRLSGRRPVLSVVDESGYTIQVGRFAFDPRAGAVAWSELQPCLVAMLVGGADPEKVLAFLFFVLDRCGVALDE